MSMVRVCLSEFLVCVEVGGLAAALPFLLFCFLFMNGGRDIHSLNQAISLKVGTLYIYRHSSFALELCVSLSQRSPPPSVDPIMLLLLFFCD